MTGVQVVSLFVGIPTLAYTFLSIILIATSAVIAWYAWRWHKPDGSIHMVADDLTFPIELPAKPEIIEAR